MKFFPPPLAPSGDPAERDYRSDSFQLGTLTTIVLAHDYLCPWCWIGMLHAKKLKAEFGVTFDWRGFELVPPSMNYTPAPKKPVDPDAPPPPPAPKSRFDLFVETEGFTMPSPRPGFVLTHNALMAAEWAFIEAQDGFEALNEAIYRAFWEQQKDISDVDLLASLADGVGLSGSALADSVRAARYEHHVIPYDDDAYANGIRHVPTFLFNGEEKIAEANYTDLAHATERYLVRVEKFRAKLAEGK